MIEREAQRQEMLGVRPFGVVAPNDRFAVGVVVERPGAGQAGTHAQELVVFRSVVGRYDARVLRPRPHDRHVATQNVDQLRQLIQLDPSQEAPEAKHARVSGRGDDAPAIAVRLDMHRAQLVHREHLAVASGQACTEENRPFAAESDADRDECE
jgi:hypothetical protein